MAETWYAVKEGAIWYSIHSAERAQELSDQGCKVMGVTAADGTLDREPEEYDTSDFPWECSE